MITDQIYLTLPNTSLLFQMGTNYTMAVVSKRGSSLFSKGGPKIGGVKEFRNPLKWGLKKIKQPFTQCPLEDQCSALKKIPW